MLKQNATILSARSVSKAPRTSPPTLSATTNKRKGRSSISWNPQISLCRPTASANSTCRVSFRISIIPPPFIGCLPPLRLDPEFLQPFERRLRHLPALGLHLFFNKGEASPESRVGFPQCLLRIRLQYPAYIDEGEEKISQLVFDLAGIRLLPRRPQFRNLFAHFFKSSAHIRPIKTHGRHFGRNLFRLNQCRQRARHIVENRYCPWLPFLAFFLLFDLVPAQLHVFRRFG